MEIANVIKYEGDNSTFIWKHPCEDFYTSTQLIVHESQEAIFFLNGQALDLFGAGRHTLETQNVPIMKKIQLIPTDGETPFHCEVYFINKTEQMAIKWGTDSKVQYMEPQYHFPINIGASGEMSLRVEDSRRLLLKLVGTESGLKREQLVAYFRGILLEHVKAYIAQIMNEEQISIFEVDAKLGQFSKSLKERLMPDFAAYGIALERFVVTTVVKPDGESSYERFKKIFFEESIGIREERLQQQRELIRQETASQRMKMESDAMAFKRKTEGYTYQQEKGFEVAKELAGNEGVGNFTNAGIGLGMMAGVGGGMGAAVANLTTQAMSPVSMGVAVGNNMGTVPADNDMPDMISLKLGEGESARGNTADGFKQKVEKLKMMKESGLLTEEEFNSKKSKLLEEIGL